MNVAKISIVCCCVCVVCVFYVNSRKEIFVEAGFSHFFLRCAEKRFGLAWCGSDIRIH